MPYIYSIDQLGKVIVRFNDTMLVPVTDIEKKRIDDHTDKRSMHRNRKLNQSNTSNSFESTNMVNGMPYDSF